MAYGYVERVTRLHEVEQAVERTSEQTAHEPPFEIAPCLREIGRGGSGARSLDVARARTLFEAIFAGRVDDLALGAVMIALRVKGESVDEIEGALAALDSHIDRIAVDLSRPVVAIPSYNGARKMANLTPLLACLLADAGLQVIVHGVTDDAMRTTTHQIMLAMGIAPVEHVDDAADLLSRNDPAFVPIDVLSPALARMLALRRRLGVRNIGHTLAKLLNPSPSEKCLRLTSFTHPEFDELQHALFTRLRQPALVMRGTEGEVVANAKRRARIDWLHDGRCDVMLEAETLPMGEVPSLPPAHDAVATASWIQSVLSGERPVPPSIASQVDCVLAALKPAAVPGDPASGGRVSA